MNLEKENGNIKWFKDDGLKIRIKNKGEKSEVWAILKGYNISFKLIMFDFIQSIKEELMLDILVKKTLDGQRIFIVDSNYVLELANYISEFIKEWNIQINTNTVSDSDIISDEIWYSQFL